MYEEPSPLDELLDEIFLKHALSVPITVEEIVMAAGPVEANISSCATTVSTAHLDTRQDEHLASSVHELTLAFHDEPTREDIRAALAKEGYVATSSNDERDFVDEALRLHRCKPLSLGRLRALCRELEGYKMLSCRPSTLPTPFCSRESSRACAP